MTIADGLFALLRMNVAKSIAIAFVLDTDNNNVEASWPNPIAA